MKDFSKKELVFFKICDSVLYHEVMKGHLKWSLSDVSKQADVTRSLIYYYLGKEKVDIVHESVLFMLDLFFNTSGENKLGVRDRMKNVLIHMKEMPHLYLYYISERSKDTKYGRLIQETEKNLIVYLQKELGLSEVDVMRLLMLNLGAVSFQLDPSRVDEIYSIVPAN
ncbi:TetR/AcrR family transcriptional regulator [Halobacteriovorax sp. HLS]|uniref:TetR/AcrR family transcriptional regulator n=1 Tax=Halobacteriovorax sp. HLS TaxID=2234000 RepID=UPI000FD75990|nr:TetR/AcrR family transcriptional regulator [Halobacteriovorax sp. HLS]